jgi:hypothetical protein
LDVRKTAGTKRAEGTRHGMEMWNIHLVKRLAERKGSIAREEQVRETFALMLQAYAIYPTAVGATKVGLYYHFHSLSSEAQTSAFCNPTHLKRSGHLTCLPSGPLLPGCLTTRAQCPSSLPATLNTMTQTESLTAILTACLEDSTSLPATGSISSHSSTANCKLTQSSKACGAALRRSAAKSRRLATCSGGALDTSWRSAGVAR